MRKELKTCDNTKSPESKIDETGNEEIHEVIVYSPETCYLCKNLMRSYRNDLITTTSYTDRALYEILGKYSSFGIQRHQLPSIL